MWELELKQKLVDQGQLMLEDDFSVFLFLLREAKEFSISELLPFFPGLKRTHIYAIISRLEEQGWIQPTDSTKRPTKYKSLNPLAPLRHRIQESTRITTFLEDTHEFVKDSVIPHLHSGITRSGNIQSTYIIYSLDDFYTEIKQALQTSPTKIMVYMSEEFVMPIVDEIIQAQVSHLRREVEQGTRLTSEYIREHIAFLIVEDDEFAQHGKVRQTVADSKLGEVHQSVYYTGSISTQLLVVNDIVYIFNVETGFGLPLKIQDPTVAGTYSSLISYTFLENRIEQYARSDISLVQKYITTSHAELVHGIQELVEQGWKIFPDHSTDDARTWYEIGVVSPKNYHPFFRIAGIQLIKPEIDKPQVQQLQEFAEFAKNSVMNYLSYLSYQVEYELQEDFSLKTTKYVKARAKLQDSWKTILEAKNIAYPLHYQLTEEFFTIYHIQLYESNHIVGIWATDPESVESIVKALSLQ